MSSYMCPPASAGARGVDVLSRAFTVFNAHGNHRLWDVVGSLLGGSIPGIENDHFRFGCDTLHVLEL